MFKASNSPVFIQGRSPPSEPNGLAFEEPELEDCDGLPSETWTASQQLAFKCWAIYHNYAKRYRQLERLEKYGTLEEVADDDDSDEQEKPEKEKEEAEGNEEDVNQEDTSDDVECDGTWPETSFSMFHEKKEITILANRLLLRRGKHLQWLFRHLAVLPTQQFSLDASRPWIVFWITQAIGLLNGWESATPEQLELRTRVVPFMLSLQHPSGGYGGGPRQLPHLASTYAAVAALINVGTEEAFASIDRQGIYTLIQSLRVPETGGFQTHEDGEVDPRGAYCAVGTASLLHIVTNELFEGIEDYVGSLQSFDGGLSGEPGLESHGGYTYCGLASLAVLGKQNEINLHQLLLWIVSRQSDCCGGFSGRPNKLTDSCYSFWSVGALAILDRIGYKSSPFEDPAHQRNSGESTSHSSTTHPYWFDHVALQLYILGCCQEGASEEIYSYKGGLRDKPDASPDYYHTCYSLSGLASSQHANPATPIVAGLCTTTNLLRETDPFYNIDVENIQKLREYFARNPFTASNGEVGTEGAGVIATLERTRKANNQYIPEQKGECSK